jgi:alkylation response protein AidB-like acyl-CoA dehydrogenase
MSHYKVDMRDVTFALFDWLNVGQLSDHEPFKTFEIDEDTMKMVIEEAYKFAFNEVSPLFKDSEFTAEFEDGKVKLPPEFKKAFDGFCENGWLSLTANPEFGGQGFPGTIGAAAMEFFCGASIAFTMYPELSHGAAHILEAFGSDWLKETFVEKMYAGKWAGTMCLTEPGAGSDVGALKTKAIKQDDGTYKIVGTKIFISSGDHELTPNIIHPVLARVEGAPAGIKGVSIFMVPKYLVNEDGSLGDANDVACSGIEHKMGIKASATCTLNFGENDNCKGWLIGEENQGIKYMFQMMNEARLYVGLQGAALAGASYMSALDYAKERVQFRHIKDMAKHDAPGVPIIEHPDIRRSLMFMKSISEGCRALLYKTAFYHDMAKSAEGADKDRYEGLVELLVPICKAYSSDWGFDVTETGVQILGGYGYCSEYPLEQYCRDVKIASIYEGANGIQALDLLGRKLSMKGGMLFMTYMQELSTFVEKAKADEKLGGLGEKLAEAQNWLATTVMDFGSKARSKEPTQMILPVLNATPFLDMFGHVVISQLLLEQALVANEKLDALCQEKGAADGAAKRALYAENDEAKFLYGKTQSAAWFINNMLPQAEAIMKSINNGDLSAMKMVF